MRTPVLAALFSLACAVSAAALPQEIVREFGDPTPFDRSSWVDSAVGVGDVNGDGHADLIAADRREQGVDAPGVVRLVSGLDGAILARFEADPSLFQLGSTMALLEDVDGDGMEDIAVTPGGTGNHKRARVHSGADDSLLFWEQFQTLAPWVDAEGDGLRDFADHQLGGDNGFLRVWRNTPIYLWAEDRALKVGQPLEFRLRSGPAQGKVLLLALKGRNLPSDLVLGTGTLDAQGRWDAPSLTIPPGTEGLTFDCQAHVLPAGGGPLLSSAVKDVRVN